MDRYERLKALLMKNTIKTSIGQLLRWLSFCCLRAWLPVGLRTPLWPCGIPARLLRLKVLHQEGADKVHHFLQATVVDRLKDLHAFPSAGNHARTVQEGQVI